MEKHEIREHRIIRELPRDKNCFVCGVKAADGLRMKIYATDDGYAIGLCRTEAAHQGFPGVAHGGIVSACLDEVLWFSTRLCENAPPAMTVELNIHFLAKTPTESNLRVAAKLVRTEGRHLYSKGFILLEDGTVAAEAEGHFLALRPEDAAVTHGIYTLVDGDDLPETVWF
ncbi:MAG: PaaI family thioesterase [Oscillospiraceae bacterium]|nr:PaaI family thioesterase [Oscillospiraceae bacterium]